MPDALAPLPLCAAIYLALSVVTFIAYGVDKRRAERGERRIPERTLHLLELGFGWPGALVAQQVFRHKRRKIRYLVVFGMIVALHLGVGGWLWIHGLPWLVTTDHHRKGVSAHDLEDEAAIVLRKVSGDVHEAPVTRARDWHAPRRRGEA